MPAVLTHDFFGRDTYDRNADVIGAGREEVHAFLLGNQGPDPLFYCVISPRCAKHSRLGHIMHDEKAAEQMVAFRHALEQLDEEAGARGGAGLDGAAQADTVRGGDVQSSVARAYVLGFLCHYALDSTMHPLVYANQFALCDAGIEGLSRKDGNEVHATIESEFDEMVLFTKLGETIATYVPVEHALRAAPKTLATISELYKRMAREVWGMKVPTDLFAVAVHDFRIGQRAFYSRTGTKRAALGKLEELLRPYSFYRAMSHRPVEALTCRFDNHEHAVWQNPFTHKESTQDFWELYAAAADYADTLIEAFAAPEFTLEQARALTGGRNFSGDPVDTN